MARLEWNHPNETCIVQPTKAAGRMRFLAATAAAAALLSVPPPLSSPNSLVASAFSPGTNVSRRWISPRGGARTASAREAAKADAAVEAPPSHSSRGSGEDEVEDEDEAARAIFVELASFLRAKQRTMISDLEEMDGSGESFSEDCWGVFADDGGGAGVTVDLPDAGSGGVTRVIQGGGRYREGGVQPDPHPGGVPERRASSDDQRPERGPRS